MIFKILNSFLFFVVMPVQRRVRQATGNHRRQPNNQVQLQYRPSRGLSTNAVALRLCLQQEMMSALLSSRAVTNNIQNLLLASYISQCPRQRFILRREARFLFEVDNSLYQRFYQYYSQQETLLCDIPPQLDVAHVYSQPRNRTINALTDHESVQFTRFSKNQLRRILRCFNFPANIRIQGYRFQREEIFLFSLTKIALGLNNYQLCLLIFGGSEKKWSHAYKYFLFHLYARYYPTIIGFNGLEREVQNFPYYALKIAQKLNQERIQLRNNTYQQVRLNSITVDVNDNRVACYIDGHHNEISTPGTGPNGNYVGSQRKDNHELIQESVYSGYTKLHGIVVLSLMLPTGIHYLFGPCSSRENDRWLANQSGVDNFLFNLQNQHANLLNNRIYCAYGDKTFVNGQCLRRAHQGDGNNPLPLRLRLENDAFKAVRISIEHGFAEVANKFQVCTQYSEFKLMQDRSHAREQLVACFLMSNIYSCLNGSQMCSTDTYFCVAPSLEEYLEIGDEI